VRWLRVGSALGLVSAACLFANDTNALWVIVFSVLLNSVLSGVVPLSDAHALQLCRKDLGAYGRVRLWGSLGFIACVMGFGQWGAAQGLAAYPWFVMALLVLTFLSCAWMRDIRLDAADSGAGQLTRFGELLMAPALRWFWLSSFCMIAAHGALYGFYSLYLQHNGYTTDWVGVLWTIGVLAEVVFFWFQGRWFGRFPAVVWLRWATLACMLRFALIAALPDVLLLLALVQCAHALTFAAHHTAAMSWLRDHCGPGLLARGQATYTTIAYGMGGFLGASLAGQLWVELSPSAVFYMASLFGLASFLCVMRIRQV
jgi:PPP family 3-phenylpropionic acid transporter